MPAPSPIRTPPRSAAASAGRPGSMSTATTSNRTSHHRTWCAASHACVTRRIARRLAGGDGLGGLAEPRARPRLDLAHHQPVARPWRRRPAHRRDIASSGRAPPARAAPGSAPPRPRRGAPARPSLPCVHDRRRPGPPDRLGHLLWTADPHGDNRALPTPRGRARRRRWYGAQEPNGPSPGSRRSGLSSSSTFTSLKVSTRTFLTNRAGRYMSHTQASDIRTSK